jgi:recombination protein RecT
MSNQLAIVQNNLESLILANRQAIPENFNTARFIQNCLAVLPEIKDIEKVEASSIARTMVRAAYLGLDFFSKECYSIVYNKNIGTKEHPQWVKELQFQTDYRGEVKLAKKYSFKKIHDIYAKLVREGDAFEEIIYRGKPTINFQPKPFNNGKIIGVFAVCLYDDKTMIYETMSAEEVDNIRTTYSKMPDGKAWKESPGEMAKKTVIRRLRKMIQLEFDNPQQIEAYEAGGDAEFTEAEEIKEPIRMPEPIGKLEQSINDANKETKPEELKPKKTKEEMVKKIQEWVLTLSGGDQDKAKRMLMDYTSFGEDGNKVKGVWTTSELQRFGEKRLAVTYGKVKKDFLEVFPESEDKPKIEELPFGETAV